MHSLGLEVNYIQKALSSISNFNRENSFGKFHTVGEVIPLDLIRSFIEEITVGENFRTRV